MSQTVRKWITLQMYVVPEVSCADRQGTVTEMLKLKSVILEVKCVFIQPFVTKKLYC